MGQPFNPQDYSKRITDIKCGLEKLGIDDSSNKAIRFLAYFFACEKLATAMVGIKKQLAPKKVFHQPFKLLLPDINSAADKFGLNALKPDLTHLFGCDGHSAKERKPNLELLSARELRNKLVHHFGPTHVGFILERESFFKPIMMKFLNHDRDVLSHIAKPVP